MAENLKVSKPDPIKELMGPFFRSTTPLKTLKRLVGKSIERLKAARMAKNTIFFVILVGLLLLNLFLTVGSKPYEQVLVFILAEPPQYQTLEDYMTLAANVAQSVAREDFSQERVLPGIEADLKEMVTSDTIATPTDGKQGNTVSVEAIAIFVRDGKAVANSFPFRFSVHP